MISSTEERESIFLNEYLMAAACIFAVVTSLILLIFFRSEANIFSTFEILIKMITAVSMFFAFRHYNWDVAKGLMAGVLFSLMYQEAYFVLDRLWGEQDFDIYLVAGVQGSLYLAAAGMSFLMTIVITINHFHICYGLHGTPQNVIFNRVAIIFKFGVYIMLLAANSRLGFSPSILWKNALQYLTDMAVLLLTVSIESQFDSFKLLRQELMMSKRKKEKEQ